LKGESPDDLLGAEAFLNLVGEGSFNPFGFISDACRAAHERAWQHDAQQKSGDGRRRQSPFEREKDGAADHDADGAEHDASEGGVEDVFERAQVGGETCHEVTGAMPREKRRGHSLEVGEDSDANIAQDAAAEK
jgi:hypothetical protein